jgi:hypothetical protein
MLPHLTETCISKTKRLRTYVVHRFRLVFNKGSHCGELVRKFSFTLHACVCVCVRERVRVCVRACVQLMKISVLPSDYS